LDKVRRLVFIVAPGQQELYASLNRTFAGDDTVRVVLDRRRGERRRTPAATAAERRQRDRRKDARIDRQLRERGYAVVGVTAVRASKPRR
jgi:hypothetical protein